MLQFWIVCAIFTSIEIMLVLGLNVQYGVCGLLNLSYVVVLAAGAYTTAVLTMPPAHPPMTGSYILGEGLPFYVGVIGGMVAGGLVSALIGAFALGRRLRSSYLAVSTLVIAVAMLQVVTQDQGLFNGAFGLIDVPQPFGRGLSTNAYSYLWAVITIILAAAVCLVCELLRRSPFGRVLRSIREDEVAAQVFGYNIFRMKMAAFIFGGVIAGLVGAITVLYSGSWSPSAWSVAETLFAITCIVVGGAGSTTGVVVGAAVIEIGFAQATLLLPTIQSDPGLIATLRSILVPVLLLVVLRFRPQGVFPERMSKVPEVSADTDAPALIDAKGE